MIEVSWLSVSVMRKLAKLLIDVFFSSILRSFVSRKVIWTGNLNAILWRKCKKRYVLRISVIGIKVLNG